MSAKATQNVELRSSVRSSNVPTHAHNVAKVRLVRVLQTIGRCANARRDTSEARTRNAVPNVMATVTAPLVDQPASTAYVRIRATDLVE